MSFVEKQGNLIKKIELFGTDSLKEVFYAAKINGLKLRAFDIEINIYGIGIGYF